MISGSRCRAGRIRGGGAGIVGATHHSRVLPGDEMSSFKVWYGRNRGRLNKRRRRRYARDLKYRRKVVLASRRWRSANPKELAYDDGTVSRRVGPAKVKGYRIGETALRVGVSSLVIRRLEMNGIIPRTTMPGKHRVYTHRQVEMLRDLLEVIGSRVWGWRKLSENQKEAVYDLCTNWK